jgi:bifunctional UDP-N-acetylglucosamine pyrophosphorylase/glucosamine-1-phosphate N-acetyltransferase
LGINSREDLAVAEKVLRQRILRDFMLQGVTIIDPQTTYIDANVRIGQDTIIRPFTVIENNVRIGKNCSVGPFARLRPGTRIDDNVEVGNFAEVSRTRLGSNSRMKHFSFLGDAEVGKNVNIGAGVVTANYDGKNKNKTQILDYAFVGSDSILVAPVKIGKRAMTGAGCVVTKGQRVPDGKVILGVPGRILEKKK